ncbi:MAG TPA: porin [Gemmatimonadales bacterium]|nr:porin [Gemmatimonadales bacterium]
MRLRQAAPLLCAIASAALLAFAPTELRAQDSADQPRTVVGGYGEIHYQNSSLPDSTGHVNLARFVLYLGHSFNERITFRSEVEVEDARVEGGGGKGELEIEQAYIDYRFSDPFTLRAGLVLIPAGIINELHEPPTFNGVERPLYDQLVIPTTWREIGVGLAGRIPQVEGLAYRAYFVNGLRSEGFTGAEGIREGSGEGQDANFANAALTGRLEWVHSGLRLGTSAYYGGSAANTPGLGTGLFAAPVFLIAADARYDIGAFAFRGEAGNMTIRDAAAINAFFANSVGDRIAGFYLEGAWNALSLLAPSSTQRLAVFARYDKADTHASVPDGTPRNGAYNRNTTTLGLTWKPISGLAFKGDYQLRRNAAHFLEDETVNLGLGWQF